MRRSKLHTLPNTLHNKIQPFFHISEHNGLCPHTKIIISLRLLKTPAKTLMIRAHRDIHDQISIHIPATLETLSAAWLSCPRSGGGCRSSWLLPHHVQNLLIVFLVVDFFFIDPPFDHTLPHFPMIFYLFLAESLLSALLFLFPVPNPAACSPLRFLSLLFLLFKPLRHSQSHYLLEKFLARLIHVRLLLSEWILVSCSTSGLLSPLHDRLFHSLYSRLRIRCGIRHCRHDCCRYKCTSRADAWVATTEMYRAWREYNSRWWVKTTRVTKGVTCEREMKTTNPMHGHT